MNHRREVRQRRSRLPRSRIDLIVCNSAPRWRAAVRIAVQDAVERFPEMTLRLLEVEELAQVSQALQTSPGAILALEIGEENCRVVERWLREPRPENAPVVGLLSISNPPSDLLSSQEHLQRTATLAVLIREAGAIWTIESPLEVSDLLEIVLRRACLASRPFSDFQQIAEDIWHSLPWQSTRTPLRLNE
jgi:hypothetical protein